MGVQQQLICLTRKRLRSTPVQYTLAMWTTERQQKNLNSIFMVVEASTESLFSATSHGNPKGFAYVEFTDKDCVDTAMALDDSLFRGRQIKVMPKRTNKPGISSTNRPPRGRGGGFRGQRGYRGRGGFGAIRRPRFRGRGYF